jgi:long-chain fatty acid transport protein
MMMKLNQLMIAGAVSMLLSSQAFASGFMIPEQGARAMGMGNAYSAIADEASANWFNPAGLSFQDNNVSVSGDLVYPINDFETGGQTYSTKKAVHVVPQAYMRYGMEDSALSFGLGINAPFGLSVDWTGSGAPFSQLAAGSDAVTFSEIQAVLINPNIAYQISDNFSVAVGIQYYNAFKVHLDGQSLNIGGSGDGFGGNFAAIYKTDTWSIGTSYRSKVKVDITGTAVGQEGLALVGLQGIGANAATAVTFPDLYTLSAAFQATPDLLLSAQVDRINWATFDKIEVNYDPSALNIATGTSSTIPEGWKATVAVRLGAEWKMNQSTRLRMGYTKDPTPTNPTDFSPRLPGNDRQLVSLGYGQTFSDNLTMDLAYMYVWLDSRTATAPTKTAYHGTFTGKVHLFAGGVTYHF